MGDEKKKYNMLGEETKWHYTADECKKLKAKWQICVEEAPKDGSIKFQRCNEYLADYHTCLQFVKLVCQLVISPADQTNRNDWPL